MPGKADKAEQEKFWRLIEAKLAEDTEETAVYYADGTHPQHNTHCVHGWIKKGQNKQIETNSGKKRVDIKGVINAHDPTDVVIEERASINDQSTIALLKKLEQKNRSLHRIFVVADNARLQKSNSKSLSRDVQDTDRISTPLLSPSQTSLNACGDS